METPSASPKQRSPWVYVLLGCGGLAGLICLGTMAVVGFGVKAANDILPGELKPMEGKALRASLHGSAIHINGATIVQSDIRATNGVIHAIDDVLVPLNPILAAVA